MRLRNRREDAGPTATREDISRAAADLMLLAASAGSLAAVVLTLVEAGSVTGTLRGLLIALAVGVDMGATGLGQHALGRRMAPQPSTCG